MTVLSSPDHVSDWRSWHLVIGCMKGPYGLVRCCWNHPVHVNAQWESWVSLVSWASCECLSWLPMLGRLDNKVCVELISQHRVSVKYWFKALVSFVWPGSCVTWPVVSLTGTQWKVKMTLGSLNDWKELLPVTVTCETQLYKCVTAHLCSLTQLTTAVNCKWSHVWSYFSDLGLGLGFCFV